MTSDGVLTIDLAGQRQVLQQSDVLTFGRAADLIVDEANPYLHRVVGRFFWHGGSWWLENLGSHIELEVVPEDGTVSRLPASQPDSTPVVHALAPPGFRIRFESGGVTYELAGELSQGPVTGDMPSTQAMPPPLSPLPDAPPALAPDAPPPGPSPVAAAPRSGSAVAPETVVLAPAEQELLACLAGPLLQDPTRGPEGLPSDDEVAGQLGWSPATVHRTLDYLCGRLTRAGVRGLYGRSGDRRWPLVRHAIDHGLVPVGRQV